MKLAQRSPHQRVLPTMRSQACSHWPSHIPEDDRMPPSSSRHQCFSLFFNNILFGSFSAPPLISRISWKLLAYMLTVFKNEKQKMLFGGKKKKKKKKFVYIYYYLGLDDLWWVIVGTSLYAWIYRSKHTWRYWMPLTQAVHWSWTNVALWDKKH